MGHWWQANSQTWRRGCLGSQRPRVVPSRASCCSSRGQERHGRLILSSLRSLSESVARPRRLDLRATSARAPCLRIRHPPCASSEKEPRSGNCYLVCPAETGEKSGPSAGALACSMAARDNTCFRCGEIRRSCRVSFFGRCAACRGPRKKIHASGGIAAHCSAALFLPAPFPR